MEKTIPGEGYSGRGLPLIRGICEDFKYNNEGNAVTAKLRWPKK
jgi:anti-sigma regulatory factor (Ser/Thr protein kinase)